MESGVNVCVSYGTACGVGVYVGHTAASRGRNTHPTPMATHTNSAATTAFLTAFIAHPAICAR